MNILVARWRAWRMCAVIGLCLVAQPAHAGPRTLRVVIGDDDAIPEIRVHHAYITELRFPDRVKRVAATDDGSYFSIEALEDKVLLRPRTKVRAGSRGNLLIESKTWRVIVLFRVAEDASDAVVSVTFTLPEPPQETAPTTAPDAAGTTATDAEAAKPNAQADRPAMPADDPGKAADRDDKPAVQADTPDAQADQSDAQATQPGAQATQPGAQAEQPGVQTDDAASDVTPSTPAQGTEAATGATEPLNPPAPDPAETPARPHLARGELPVSVQVHGTIGHALIGDRMAADQTDGVLLAGVTARIGYPANRYLGYDAGLSVAGSGAAHMPGVVLDRDTGEMVRTMMLARFELGASARLPVRVTPVVRVAVGVQSRAWLASRLVLASGAAVEGPDDTLLVDLTGSASVGIDVRITHAWRAGAGVTALRAAPLDNGPLFEAWEGSIHVRWN